MITRRELLAAVTVLPGPSLERRVFDAVNFQRVCKDREPLIWDDRLADVARQHSRRMLAMGFFGHRDPQFGDPGERLSKAGVAWVRCAENVFREKDYDDPVALAVIAWMYSPGHRANLLNPDFSLTGVGIATNADARFAITQNFIKSR